MIVTAQRPTAELREGSGNPGSRTEVGKAEEVECLRLPQPQPLTILGRVATERVRDWAEAYPKARILAAPGVKDRAGDRLPVGAFELDGASVDGWGETISCLPVTSRYMTEVVLFLHPSRYFVLCEMIENFEPVRMVY